MLVIRQKYSTLIIAGLLLACFSFLFYSKISRPGWIYVGDTINVMAMQSFHYSGFARGEYPFWNPLVRSGEPNTFFQITHCLGNPLSNLVVFALAILRDKDMVFSYGVFVYLLIVLYALGVFLLVSSWTSNRHAGLFASILAICSSSVFFFTYHSLFVKVLYAVPWMLYSASSYFRKFHLKYLIIFALFYCLFLYSYEFIMGLAFFVALLISCLIFYNKQILKNIYIVKRIPWHHLPIFFCLILMLSLPLVFIYFDSIHKFILTLRATDIKIDDQYRVSFLPYFTKLFWFPLTHPKFFATLFTGVFFDNVQELRHYIVPFSFPFLCVALFSLRKCIWCVLAAGIIMCLLAGNLFPANLLLRAPALNMIRNLHFLNQFFIFSLIIISGFGYHFLIRGKNIFLKRIFNFTSALFLCAILAVFLSLPALNAKTQYNTAMLLFSFLPFIFLIFLVNFFPKIDISSSVLFFCCLASLFFYANITRLPVLSGGIISNKDLLALRNRSDHSLKFMYERPEEIEKLDLASFWERFETDIGDDEYSAVITLKDNSYKTSMRGGGLSAFPVLKNYYLFASLAGSGSILKKKFWFFNKFFVSDESKQMHAFKEDPALLEGILRRGVCLVDNADYQSNGTDLGVFNPSLIKELPIIDNRGLLAVTVNKYMANSIELDLSVKEPGVFVYSDMWDEGWRGYLNGRRVPVRKVFHAFKGIFVPEGKHRIKFSYLGNTFISIVFMNIIFWLCCFILLIYLLKDRLACSYGKIINRGDLR